MQVMVTVTANDSSPEMLAAIRRGPFSEPTEEELIEYLLQRKRRDQERPPFENYSLEHVLAFQRRVAALKQHFLRRGEKTPLGHVTDWWDHTLNFIIIASLDARVGRYGDWRSELLFGNGEMKI